MMQKLRVALGWLGVALILSFVFQNLHTTNINYWPLTQIQRTPVAVIMIGCAALGAFALHMFQAYRRGKDKK